MSNLDFINYFNDVPKTGVIYVLEKAVDKGYTPQHKDWANLGQGAPDTAPLSNDEQIEKDIPITCENSEYAPVSGHIDLRKHIADYYNKIFRRGKSSLYTYKNVCVAGGGRMALSRLVAALGHINMGHFIPDYTAYEELLGAFKTFVPIPISLKKEHDYKLPVDLLKDEIVSKGLSALLISNPCNPTGQVLMGNELNKWVQCTNALSCVSIYDEFYSHYIYDKNTNNQATLISASEYIDDVNKDPVVIINGLSKNWRSPGWRVGWLLAPESIVERVSSVGSFLDGGAVHPLQSESIKKIDINGVYEQASLIQRVFSEKRNYMLTELKKLGFIVDVDPKGAFYVWCNLEKMPASIRDCHSFFEACLEQQVITVPGIFFDVNPGKRRLRRHSSYNNYVRISYGPDMATLKVGIAGIKRAIEKAK